VYVPPSLYSVFPARAPLAVNGNCSLTPVEVSLGIVCGDDRSAATQAGYQVALLVCSLGFALIGGSIAGEYIECIQFTTWMNSV